MTVTDIKGVGATNSLLVEIASESEWIAVG
jgi:hypothetical protein